jgi:hypothetical protein
MGSTGTLGGGGGGNWHSLGVGVYVWFSLV